MKCDENRFDTEISFVCCYICYFRDENKMRKTRSMYKCTVWPDTCDQKTYWKETFQKTMHQEREKQKCNAKKKKEKKIKIKAEHKNCVTNFCYQKFREASEILSTETWTLRFEYFKGEKKKL